MRPALLSLAGLACTTLLHAQDPGLDVVPFATGLAQPVDVTHAGDGTGRLFVTEKGGAIRILNADGSLRGTFLDIGGQITTQSERGLLGLAFAPDYATSGRFYVNYTDTIGRSVIARFGVSPTDPDAADSDSEEVLLTIPQPKDNHNGGDLTFGSDGLLYVAMGDGGGGNDEFHNGQDETNLLGAILRLDVSGATGYVPRGDYGGNAAPEVFATGLRNPFRFGFDPATDELWIGDVGQNAREEIDVVPKGATGLNFGWVCYEGTRDNRGNAIPADDCGELADYTSPVFEYTHDDGRKSVTGGLVYRGGDYPTLDGFYVFGDYVQDELYALRNPGTPSEEFYTYPGAVSGPSGFGRDEAGELYVASLFGDILRVVVAPTLPVALTELHADAIGCDSVLVRWAAASESNFSRYVVQTSPDGLTWTPAARVAPRADRAYGARVAAPSARVYVRLRSVDLDDTYELSEVLSVERDCGEEVRLVSTLVALGDELEVRGAPAGEINLIDASGRRVRGVQIATGGSTSIPTAGLAAGTYVVVSADWRQKVILK